MEREWNVGGTQVDTFFIEIAFILSEKSPIAHFGLIAHLSMHFTFSTNSIYRQNYLQNPFTIFIY